MRWFVAAGVLSSLLGSIAGAQTPDPQVIPAPAAATSTPPEAELAFYRVTFGMFGQVGEISLATIPGQRDGAPVVRAMGVARGNLMGFGQMERWVDAEYVPTLRLSRRWTMRRRQSGTTVTDFTRQENPGRLTVLRQRDDRPDESHDLVRDTLVLDPISFLMRLRAEPSEGATTYEVLDGRGLWRMELAAAEPVADRPDLLRIEGRALPLAWDGSPAPQRGTRRFTLYLARDGRRTPIAIVLPLPLGEVRVDLVNVARATTPPPTRRLRSYLRWLASVRTRPAPVRAP